MVLYQHRGFGLQPHYTYSSEVVVDSSSKHSFFSRRIHPHLVICSYIPGKKELQHGLVKLGMFQHSCMM
jgi:hypothetical protein